MTSSSPPPAAGNSLRFSNNAFIASFLGGPPNVTQADWSIRTGRLSEGNAGTLIAGGVGAATRTLTGRAPNFLYQEYTLEVAGLSVFLVPGTYWLNVTPLFGGDAFVSATRGGNAIGVPLGNNGNAFLDWPSGGYNFAGQGQQNFSLGVRGVAVPEPGTSALVLGVLLPLAGLVVCRSAMRPRAC